MYLDSKCLRCGKHTENFVWIKSSEDNPSALPLPKDFMTEIGVECGCYRKFQLHLIKNNISIVITENNGMYIDFPSGEVFKRVYESFMKGHETFVFR